MTRSYRLMLGDRMLPIDMRAIAADERGDIIRIERTHPITFAFTYRGLAVAGNLTILGDEEARLRLTAEIAVAAADRARNELARIARSASRLCGSLLSYDGSRLLLETEVPVRGPLTAVNLVSGIAACLAPAAPYVDLARQRMAEAA